MQGISVLSSVLVFPLMADVIWMRKKAARTAGCIIHLAVLPSPNLSGVVWWTQQLWVIKCNNWIMAHCTTLKFGFGFFNNVFGEQQYSSTCLSQISTARYLSQWLVVPTSINPTRNFQRHIYALSLLPHLLQYWSWHQWVYITFCPPYFCLWKRFDNLSVVGLRSLF